MATKTEDTVTQEDLIAGLMNRRAYPHPGNDPVELKETHISLVFLAGDFVYKVKKSLKTDFLDYETLADRKHHCEEEVRLDRRFAPQLYMDVVPICIDNGTIRVEGNGTPIEYAVKMHRFPDGALLSERIERARVTTSEVSQLAQTIANFHQVASVCRPAFAAEWPEFVFKNSQEIIDQLADSVSGESFATLDVLRRWSDDYFDGHANDFKTRVRNGLVRECHGDLHLQNVVLWQGHLTPFDGIEFNDRLRWIDVMCDAAFLAMDLASRGHLDLSRVFVSSYLEHTGDYGTLSVLRWYLVYRSIVRALVSAMRSDQSDVSAADQQLARQDCHEHIKLAYRFTLREPRGLWITHGMSGSGKTRSSEIVVQRHDAIRLRSDVERKRLFDLAPTDRPSVDIKKQMYCSATTSATYTRLRRHATDILRSGHSVIVDATFLKKHDRQLFQDVAKQEGVSFAIVDCHADEQTLRRRIANRAAQDSDASDADLDVLEHQLSNHEPLTELEQPFVVDIPDLEMAIDE